MPTISNNQAHVPSIPVQNIPTDLSIANTIDFQKLACPKINESKNNLNPIGLTATQGSTTIQFEKPIQLISWLKKYVPENRYPVFNECIELANQYLKLNENDSIPKHLIWLSDWKLVPKTDLNFFFKLINDHYASTFSKNNTQISVQSINHKPENLIKLQSKSTEKLSNNSVKDNSENQALSTVKETQQLKETTGDTQKKSMLSNMWSDFRKRIKRSNNILTGSKIIPSISSTFISKNLSYPKKRPRSESSIDLTASSMTLNNLTKKSCNQPDDLVLKETSECEESDFIFNKPGSEDDKTGKYIGEVIPSITEGLYSIIDLAMWKKCLTLCMRDKESFDSLKNNSLYNGYLSLYFPSCFEDSTKEEASKRSSFNPQKSIVWDRLSSHQRLFFLELLFIIMKISDQFSENFQSYFDFILPPYEKVIDKIKIFMVVLGCDSLENLGSKVGSELTKSYSEPSISLVLSLLLDCLKIDFDIPEHLEPKDYVGQTLGEYSPQQDTHSLIPYVEFVMNVLNEESETGFLNHPKNILQNTVHLKTLFLRIKDELASAEKNFYAALDNSQTCVEEEESCISTNENSIVNNGPIKEPEVLKINKRKILQPQKLN